MLEFLVEEIKSASLVGTTKVRQRLGKSARRRILKRKDRLLLVTHRKDGSRAYARAGAGEELAGQSLDDLPLFGACILRLIDQHMIDALIELVVHPGRTVMAQKRMGLIDQVVVIEKTAAVLCRLI